MIERSCFLYVIGDSKDGPLKVGISANPTFRLAGLQTGYHSRLHIFFCTEFEDRQQAREIEAWLHRELAEDQMLGEWFSCSFERFWNVWAEGPR